MKRPLIIKKNLQLQFVGNTQQIVLIPPDFDLLHAIHHTQAFLENAKQNLSH